MDAELAKLEKKYKDSLARMANDFWAPKIAQMKIERDAEQKPFMQTWLDGVICRMETAMLRN